MDNHPIESTAYSLTDVPPQPPERRAGERYLSLLRVGTLVIGELRELCLIRNISAGGVMIRAYSTIPAGTPVTIELKQGQSVSGHAQWNEKDLTGITFDQRIDVVGLLASADDARPPRMPRIELACVTYVREGSNVRRTRSVNISQGGMCVESATELTVGAHVIITLSGLPPIPGVVKWQDGNSYGIGFNHALPLATLVGWLQDRQTQLDRRAS